MSAAETDVPSEGETNIPPSNTNSEPDEPKEVVFSASMDENVESKADSGTLTTIIAGDMEKEATQTDLQPVVPVRTKRKHQNEGMSLIVLNLLLFHRFTGKVEE